MKLREFLLLGGTTFDLLDRYGIASKHHPKFPNLVQFTYDQIESPMGEPIVQEARGVILDMADAWAVVARPFDKFFNYGEGHAKPIDWSTAKVQEKVDGSLMILYHYAGEWHVATRGMPDAGGPVNAMNITFADLFWSTWKKMGLQLPDEIMTSPATNKLHRSATWMFELTSPLNRVVVQHSEPKLTLIGVRIHEREFSPTSYGHVYPAVREFPLQTMADIEATFASMSPTDQEGYVVVDGNFNRVKVKNPAYVALHHLKDGFGIRRLVEIIQSNETSEFLAYFPEWKAPYEEVRGRYETLVSDLESAYERIKDLQVQKDFALEAVKTRFSAPLFMLRKGQVKSIRQALSSVHSDTMIQLLKANDVKLVI